MSYYTPQGGLPAQTELLTDRAIVTEAYTVIPKGVLRDIVTSNLPGFTKTRSWILARPIAGFATTFSQLIVEIGPGGGADWPEREEGVEGVVFVTSGELTLELEGDQHVLEAGGYAYLAAGASWAIANEGSEFTSFQWIRKAYEPLDGHTADLVRHARRRRRAAGDARHGRRMGDDAGSSTPTTSRTTCT